MSRPERHVHTGVQNPKLLPLLTVAPYAILASLVGVTVVAKRGEGNSLLVDLGLCAATALWMLWMFTLHPAWRERAVMMGVFFAGLVVLVGFLIVRDPWFGLFTPAGYFYAFGVLPWPLRLPGVAAVALESGMAQAYGLPRDNAVGLITIAVILAVNVVAMCAFAWWERDAEQKNEAREAALEQVREANRRLETSLDENAGLHKQLLIQAREAGTLDERARMAREIHDTLAQGLIGIITQLQAAEQADRDPERWRQHFTAATQLARDSLLEARRSVSALRPQPLTIAGFDEALAGVVGRWSALHGVTAEVTVTGTARPLPPETELALLRAAQEGLANVDRHARASAVAIVLTYREHEVTLDMCDDGCGFEMTSARGTAPVVAPEGSADAPPYGPGGGFGLRAMRERIEDLSGTLRVQSAPGAGTTISASVPHDVAVMRA